MLRSRARAHPPGIGRAPAAAWLIAAFCGIAAVVMPGRAIAPGIKAPGVLARQRQTRSFLISRQVESLDVRRHARCRSRRVVGRHAADGKKGRRRSTRPAHQVFE
jgi:hypothetical protein